MYLYLIVLGGKIIIFIWMGIVHGEVFQGAERWDMVNCRFYCCWCLCKTHLPCQIVLIPTICRYAEIHFKGQTIHLWDHFFDHYGNNIKKKGHNYGIYTDDMLTQNYKEIGCWYTYLFCTVSVLKILIYQNKVYQKYASLKNKEKNIHLSPQSTCKNDTNDYVRCKHDIIKKRTVIYDG